MKTNLYKGSGNYSNTFVFCCLWLLLFALYLPAARAGFVADFTGWLDHVQRDGFLDYLNRKSFHQKSLYQFTQLATWFFYKLFGIHAWLWHLLHITLQALNAVLLYAFCRQLFTNSGIKNPAVISLAGVFMFCVCPHISEVVVWEPAYHYLQGFLFILLILTCTQKYLHTQASKYAWIAGIIYFISTFSLEIFYITPWLVLSLVLYYRLALKYDKVLSRKSLLYFFLPQILLFIFYLLAIRFIYGEWVAHIGTEVATKPVIDNLGKPAKYLFHILFMGRFFSYDHRQLIYHFCDSLKGIILFYSMLLIIAAYLIIRFKKLQAATKAASLFFAWLLSSFCLLLPLWFYDMFIVIVDRYIYFTCAFLYMLLALLICIIPKRKVALVVFVLYAVINMRFTIRANRYWMKSERITRNLLQTFPETGNKPVLLLDLPANMQGIYMLGSSAESEFQLMMRLFINPKYASVPIHDVASFNMVTPEDGAHVNVLNDSVIRVTQNQWGTWWWNEGQGCVSYENEHFKLNNADGHYYDLTMKKPAADYIFLYQTGGEWKTVDWNRKNTEQY